jgi:undecaprenyl diphosphate synthase
MIEAVKNILKKYKPGQKITGEIIKENLMTFSLPPVDFLVRTGGEPHLSAGFMMWDIANSQMYFSEVLYPDFAEEKFEIAIKEYEKRERRLGK